MARLTRARAREAEVLIVAAFMQGVPEDAADRLLRQFREARVRRQSSAAGFEVEPVCTTENLLIDLDQDVRSDVVRLREKSSGQVLSFELTLRRGGFLGSLRGWTSEGAWPRRWSVDSAQAALQAHGALRLPSSSWGSAGAVADLVGVTTQALAEVRRRRPAESRDLVDLTRREGASLPTALHQLLSLTDGMQIGELWVFGTADLYRVDLGDSGMPWLVAQDSDGRHYLCDEDGWVSTLPAPLADPALASRLDAAYLEWLRAEILARR